MKYGGNEKEGYVSFVDGDSIYIHGKSFNNDLNNLISFIKFNE